MTTIDERDYQIIQLISEQQRLAEIKGQSEVLKKISDWLREHPYLPSITGKMITDITAALQPKPEKEHNHVR